MFFLFHPAGFAPCNHFFELGHQVCESLSLSYLFLERLFFLSLAGFLWKELKIIIVIIKDDHLVATQKINILYIIQE